MKAIRKKYAEKLLISSIKSSFRTNSQGSGWDFELVSPLTNILLGELFVGDIFDGYEMDSDWDNLSEEDKDYCYELWKDEMFDLGYEKFKARMTEKHIDDFIEYLEQAEEYFLNKNK